MSGDFEVPARDFACPSRIMFPDERVHRGAIALLLVGSRNAAVGMVEAMSVLRSGGSVLDAVETCIRAVESNLADSTVGEDRRRYLDHMSGFARKLTSDPELVRRLTGHDDPGKVFGTVNVIARDDRGRMACGVSTSGWAWKYPGRLGDSPIIGAGNYCDDRYGAAACTGRGEMAIRCATVRTAVMYLKLGMGIDEAGLAGMSDFNDLVDPFFGTISMVLVDRDGNHRAFSNNPEATYAYITAEMDEPAEVPRTHVSLAPRQPD